MLQYHIEKTPQEGKSVSLREQMETGKVYIEFGHA